MVVPAGFTAQDTGPVGITPQLNQLRGFLSRVLFQNKMFMLKFCLVHKFKNIGKGQ